ncbi:hypothetical protein LTS15_007141 [Exophiala xenobiotica]|nr:hypothetical protein LTS15_007141 [Exophiala xenobiotica]
MTAAALPAADHTVVTDAAPSIPASTDAPAPSSAIDQAAPAPKHLETSDDFDETFDDQSLYALAYAASAPDADATSHHNDKRSPGTMQPKTQKVPKPKKPKQYMWCTADRDYCTSWYAAPGQSFQNAKREVKRDGMSTTTGTNNKKDQEVWCAEDVPGSINNKHRQQDKGALSMLSYVQYAKRKTQNYQSQD